MDLVINKHYRFDRRVCIFFDMIVALSLLILGFLNFVYDAVLWIALELAKGQQIRMEIAAMTFLILSW